MTKFLQTLMDSVAVGSVYALIALGYTMVYGILKFINFAHSDIFVLGAWLSLVVAVGAGWSERGTAQPVPEWLWTLLVIVTLTALAALLYQRLVLHLLPERLRSRAPRLRGAGTLALAAGWSWIPLLLYVAAGILRVQAGLAWLAVVAVLLCAMSAVGLIGLAIERLAYRPLRYAPRLNVLITAIGVSLLLQNTGQLGWLFGPQPQRMPALLPEDAAGHGAQLATLAGVRVHLVDVLGVGTAVALMLALERLVFRTKVGRAMRAVSFDPRLAALMGVPVDRVISFTFVLGATLAAAAGFLYAMKYPGLNQPAHMTWLLLGLKAFVAAVVGGIGNIRGAMLGGFLIGLIELFGAAYLSPQLRDVYVFSLLIVVLLLRPTGLLGRPAAEKV